jgi:ABC-type phosphate/phosphonate transport system substrate-binding protein
MRRTNLFNRFFLPTAMRLAVSLCVLLASLLSAPSLHAEESKTATTKDAKTLTMVVMDPLAAPLACDCVKGYANRQYQRLAEALEAKLKTKVEVVWNESLVGLHEKDPKLAPDLVIGKFSVVESHGKKLNLPLRPFASLTDTEGKVTQRGLFVVRADSDAASLVDLEGATIFFGPEDCAEKWSSPRALLDKVGIAASSDSKTFQSCSEAAKALLELPEDANASAVISSYAAPLLEGCGTIKKGDLRVIGQTEDLPFVTAFVNTSLPAEQQSAIEAAVLAQHDPELLKVLESESGFQSYVSGL